MVASPPAATEMPGAHGLEGLLGSWLQRTQSMVYDSEAEMYSWRGWWRVRADPGEPADREGRQ